MLLVLFFILYYYMKIIGYILFFLAKLFDTWDQSLSFLCLMNNFLNDLKARRRIREIIREIICKRKEKRLMERDLLGHLLNYKDEKGQTLSDDQIADNVIGVLFAAQDTTASVLTWILKYLHDDQKLLEAIKVRLDFVSQKRFCKSM